jgi:ATP/maltotriose-dependent transcriptional regulator MalT
MTISAPAQLTPAAFARFGDLLRFLRRRAKLTQRDISIAVGYNFAQICRLEQGQRLPDPVVVAATFIGALGLEHEPEWAARLIELAEVAQQERRDAALAALAQHSAATPAPRAVEADELDTLELIPAPAPHEVRRQRLVARVNARLAAVRCVALCGLPGMGKTTLAAALAREYAETAPVFWLTFSPGVTTSVEALVRQLALFALAYGQTQVQSLLRPVGQDHVAPPLDRSLRLIGAALGRMAADSKYATPPLLCFDGLHLAQHDADIMRVLRHLATTTARLLLTSRESAPLLPGCPQIRLDGLDQDEGLQLIAQLLTGPEGQVAPPWAARMLEQTGGSPMLTQLALGQLLDEGADPDTFIAHLASQPQIASYLLEMVRRHTSPVAWGLLSLISVFRQPVDLYDPALVELIHEMDGAADLTAALDELIRRHLIDHPTRAQPHRLVRDYVYTALITMPLHRRQLHRIAAKWSEQELDDPVEASYHAYMAGDLAAAAAVLADHVEAIGARGRTFAAADMAELVLVQVRRQRSPAGAKSGDTAESERGLLALRGDLLLHTLRAEEAEASYREALRLTSDPAAQARIVYRLAHSLAQRGQAAEAVQLAQQAAATLAESEVSLRAQLAAAESQAHLELSRYDEAITAARLALNLADQLGAAEARAADAIRARAHQAFGTVMRLRQNPDAALVHIQRASRAAQQAEHFNLALRCRMDEAKLLFSQGQYAALLERCAEFMQLLWASDDSYGVGQLYGMMALSHLLRGELADGLAAAEQGRAVRMRIGDAHGLTLANNHRALLLIALGHVAEARVVVEQALAEYQAVGEMHNLGFALEKLAIVQMLEGDSRAAQATLREALALPAVASDAKLLNDLLHDLVVALLMAGSHAAAHQIMVAHSVEGGLWVELEHMLLEGMLALAGSEIRAARAAADALAKYARSAGVRLYEQRAAQLANACAAPAPYDWPRLMWVTES